jgi:uncharacterized protein YndB with AHSA1/START domain
MRLLVIFAAVLAMAGTAFAQTAPAVETCSRTEPSGDRTLCHSIVVEAPAAEVWRLWSTTEGLASWVAPVVAIDLRVGGDWEASYNPQARIGEAGNIRNRVVAFVPERLLVIQIADSPRGFAHEDLARELTTAIELEPIDAEHTRVRVSMLGFGETEGFEQLRQMFDAGNAYTLRKLAERIEQGDAQ